MHSKMKSIRLALVVSTIMILIASVETAEGANKKKKKKNNSSQSSEVTSVLQQVDKRLLAYDTERAQELLKPLPAEDAAVMVATGRVLVLEQKYDQAITQLAKAAAADGNDPTASLALGEAYAYAGQSGKADEAFGEAAQRARRRLEKKVNDFDALYSLGVAEQRLKRYDQSLEYLEQAGKQKSKEPLVPYQLGLTHMLRGEWSQAVDRLTQAIDLNSGFAYAYYYRGLAADKAGRKDLLVNDLDRFLALAPDAPEAPKARKILEAARG